MFRFRPTKLLAIALVVVAVATQLGSTQEHADDRHPGLLNARVGEQEPPRYNPPPDPSTVDLLHLIDISRDTIQGEWTLQAKNYSAKHHRGSQ